MEFVANLPGFKILQKIWEVIGNAIKNATGSAQELAGEVENVVKPVSELKQNVDQIKQPIESAKGEMEGLKDKTGETKDKAKDQGQDPQTTVKANEPDDACIQLSESEYYHPTDKDKVLSDHPTDKVVFHLVRRRYSCLPISM